MRVPCGRTGKQNRQPRNRGYASAAVEFQAGVSAISSMSEEWKTSLTTLERLTHLIIPRHPQNASGPASLALKTKKPGASVHHSCSELRPFHRSPHPTTTPDFTHSLSFHLRWKPYQQGPSPKQAFSSFSSLSLE